MPSKAHVLMEGMLFMNVGPYLL